MHFYFVITLQFLIMKKDSKLDCYLLYKYTDFLFVYPASFAGKRFTSTKEVNIFLEQVSINICKTLDWLGHGWYVSVISPWFSCYLEQSCLNSSDLPKQLSETKQKTNKKQKEVHKGCKNHLSEQTKHRSSGIIINCSVIIPWWRGNDA